MLPELGALREGLADRAHPVFRPELARCVIRNARRYPGLLISPAGPSSARAGGASLVALPVGEGTRTLEEAEVSRC